MVMPGRHKNSDDIVLAEASAWLARLQGPGRTPAAEAAFKAWLAVDASHAHAFARVTDTWEMVPGAARLAVQAGVDRRVQQAISPLPRRAMVLSACMMLLATVASVAWWVLQEPVYRTAVGEQRTVILDDGTRVVLNTDSRMKVAYAGRERQIRLERGEALFEVVPDPQRPFVVQARGEAVRALGTTFLVRQDPVRLVVALIEGKVEIASTVTGRGATAGLARPVLLAPGERVVMRAGAQPKVDRPRMEAVTAWQRGEVMFDDVPLAEAIAALGRYGSVRLRLARPELASLRISGVFALRDPAEFARSLAQLHGLKVEQQEGILVVLPSE